MTQDLFMVHEHPQSLSMADLQLARDLQAKLAAKEGDVEQDIVNETGLAITGQNSMRRNFDLYDTGDIVEVIERIMFKCKLLKPMNAFSSLWNMARCILANAEGGVRRRMVGCGGCLVKIAEWMGDCMDKMSDEEVNWLKQHRVNEMRHLAAELEDYFCGFPLEHVLDKLGTSFP